MESINGCTVIRPEHIEGAMTFGPEETAGAYSVLIGAGPPGSGPALHEHPTTDESFYVAEGVHTVRNEGSEDLRGLLIISPGNVEHEFVEVEL